ncbi:DNA-directed RNA polymerase subunit beta [Candidatus Roizmanbacteria bacterium RIFCSPHIGHO2_02_FULL_37_15]|uniref:DNA-directed RNA polymerase subunit beta n=1 Tax=Candidatus Roizmanbacteria bacterium RIFCSPLOWO2_01_FULL_37_16 TaxID=1802058 RepID=A0A1F7IQ69_9BACT|nr:MAG: DNA-directed RNA polymerase subunit beta [Candidatus Roizmanbacteria bacterium RIFCSPHIGHO2_01_FULL_37_16b]OGK21184.1 MAG: DNA-directed RNA polymerase subunit beta [Candidatus Roizmanbacteria bacterium RIFCSPHIGHO2_02_FULL_37_15]OGK32867.1 MAG: DNA-directed RNA polymerase subunit beta [Candidatus Roizmanbacteria bacterium RIFCSPHIGHO2_12_FULL_36_11]OGK45507.1 MAG: DNA-directed RNA polymerase subunit beta [Candidatus Roizmanbacteria bacterium RIFCSPLOWO2_01_FULL_37_16]OGK55711.1 MAG: DNA
MPQNKLSNLSSQKKILLGKEDKELEKFDLIEIQKESWEKFIKIELKEIINEFFPIEDYTKKKFILFFEDIFFGDPRYPLELCVQKKLTYDTPVYLKLRLVNKKTGIERQQEVYFFNLPKMTSRGTFIINGIERAIINQIVRSPGLYFTAEIDKTTGLTLYNAEIRPYIGAWLDITLNKNNLIEMKVNKKRKFLATVLLRAFEGDNNTQIMSLFQDLDKELIEKYIAPTLKKDQTKDKDAAVLEIYRKVRPGEPLILDNAYETLQNLFFSHRRYSLANVGRYKINKKLKLGLEITKENHLLTKKDIVETVKYLVNLTKAIGSFDDIDHLGNRRLRTVGELVSMYGIRVGMVRVEREIKERMSLITSESHTSPSQIVNSKPLIVAINSFFRTSQLSTIVDQTNPLSELDNLRRVTVGGPGGIEKERASFSIRDISSSQYGRICPIRSPEGPNIGVVTYMALYARVNKYGFLETPYRKLAQEKHGIEIKVRLSDEIAYLQADDEEKYYITSNNINIDKNNFILEEHVVCRHGGEIVEVPADKLDFIDISPRQVVGASAALIPFLQNDDASRALMGTHMQCQAVPLIKPQAPIVGTGLESKISSALNRTITSPEDGVIVYVDAKKIIIKGKSGKEFTYNLDRFIKTNKDVIFDQKPRVASREKVKKGQVIADGPATDNGKLALGQNLVVAYTSLNGLGYEDGFVISERLIKEDLLTSVTSEEFTADLVDTKLGPEELTRDIPNVREEVLQNLDKDGLVIIGTEVSGGDILVGKLAPKGEKELTAEERLLRAIFGEKAKDVKDTSLRMPYGKRGIIVNLEIIDSKKDPNELEPSVLKRIIVTAAQLRKISVGDKLAGRHGNKGVISKILPEWDMPYLEDGTPVDVILSPLSILSRMNLGQLFETLLGLIAKHRKTSISVPVFEKIKEQFISSELKKLGLPVDGKVKLFDSQTGQPYDKKVFVGVGYIMKLIHMVEDKFHARSVGPYSLVTQQPLGGKSQMGGQRFGEMEVWALETHRVPYTLQEMLTIKSDDVRGRTKAFESIIKKIDIPQSNVPESFHVLMKELNALGLAIDYIK